MTDEEKELIAGRREVDCLIPLFRAFFNLSKKQAEVGDRFLQKMYAPKNEGE